ncbi:YhbY-like protein [Dioscorea alata]|uniref:YhbY-like protein n=1 Tax=Dioscorea alata TaxID=55571 RepID=A0ACB7UBZ3_DIOAL|nr:YhbY-like protein [Dioscorea alata]
MAAASSGRLLLQRFSSSAKNLNPSTTSPWIHGWSSTHPYLRPFPKKPRDSIDYSNDDAFSSDDDEVGSSRSIGSTTMRRILNKLQKLGLIEVSNSVNGSHPFSPEKGSVEDIFHAEDGVLPNPRGLASKPEIELSEDEIRRLRDLGLRIKLKVKIKGGGLTREVVDAIHRRWRSEEVVRLKCEGPAALNMRIMHENLERRTGGMVIWRSGTSILLYRGAGYGFPLIVKENVLNQSSQCSEFLKTVSCMSRRDPLEETEDCNMQPPSERKKDASTVPENKSQIEIEKLLDNLGPRYTDWPGSDPSPIDADLLAGTVPGYKPPFRVLPYGVKSSLGPKEGTTLRRLARLLPPHFALGRNRQYQGLAAAMLVLWEKCPIAKIALKHGVQLKTSERMAEDIKKMTGGTLLSRNKDYLVFYRGKSFLSLEVAEMLLEWERSAKALE